MYIAIELYTHLSQSQMYLITNASNRVIVHYTNVPALWQVHL